jgi:hypothetical protein
MIKKRFFILLLALILGVLVWAQSSLVNLTDPIAVLVQRFYPDAIAEESFFLSPQYEIFWRILSVVFISIKYILCLVALWYKPLPCQRGASFLLYRTIRVVGGGLFAYTVLMAIILVFVFSVLGLPIAALFFLLAWLTTTIAEFPLGMAVGWLICDSMSWKTSPKIYMLIGVTCIEILRRIPFLGSWANILFLPIISFGIIVTVIYDGYLKKNFCDLSLWTEWMDSEKRPLHNTRDQILKGIFDE